MFRAISGDIPKKWGLLVPASAIGYLFRFMLSTFRFHRPQESRDLDISANLRHLNVPEWYIKVPVVHMKVREWNMKVPMVHTKLREWNMKVPVVHMKIQEWNIKGPSGLYEGPRMEYEGPNGPYESPRMEYEGPSGPYKGPRMEYKGPSGPHESQRTEYHISQPKADRNSGFWGQGFQFMPMHLEFMPFISYSLAVH
jgi:hypothetical protein